MSTSLIRLLSSHSGIPNVHGRFWDKSNGSSSSQTSGAVFWNAMGKEPPLTACRRLCSAIESSFSRMSGNCATETLTL